MGAGPAGMKQFEVGVVVEQEAGRGVARCGVWWESCG